MQDKKSIVFQDIKYVWNGKEWIGYAQKYVWDGKFWIDSNTNIIAPTALMDKMNVVIYSVEGKREKKSEPLPKEVPNDATYYNKRGEAFHKKGNYDLAIDDYAKVLSLRKEQIEELSRVCRDKVKNNIPKENKETILSSTDGKFNISFSVNGNLFDNSDVVEWINSHGVKSGILPFGEVKTLGFAPFSESDFEDFITKNSCGPMSCEMEEDVLILGKEGWEEDVDIFIEGMKGKKLKVYSQEMAVAYYLTGRDPYDSGILEEFGAGHPGLEYLMEWGFEWPKTTVVPSINSKGPTDTSWPQVGVLKCMGYTVGKRGLSVAARRLILENAYKGSIPNVQSKEHMEEWGETSTNRRLKKMANAIASFAKNHKRKQVPSFEAIEDWQEDLQWLKNSFYRGNFQWPSTEVR